MNRNGGGEIRNALERNSSKVMRTGRDGNGKSRGYSKAQTGGGGLERGGPSVEKENGGGWRKVPRMAQTPVGNLGKFLNWDAKENWWKVKSVAGGETAPKWQKNQLGQRGPVKRKLGGQGGGGSLGRRHWPTRGIRRKREKKKDPKRKRKQEKGPVMVTLMYDHGMLTGKKLPELFCRRRTLAR